MKRGSVQKHNEQTIKELSEEDTYKYLGILQTDKVKHDEMKDIEKTEYKRRGRKVLETKLNGNNIIEGINTWTIALLRYSAAVLDWTKLEKEELHSDTRKILTMHKVLHPREMRKSCIYPEMREVGDHNEHKMRLS